MKRHTLLDLTKLSGSRAVIGLIEEVLDAAPELARIPARTINGTSYTTVLRTKLPGTGFREINAGFDGSKSEFTQKLVQSYPFAGRVEVDKALALANEDGPEALQAIEATGVMQSASIEIGKQVYYGVTEDDKGFPGLQSMVSSALTLDAGGTTANTGSSVYALRTGPMGVQFVFGNNQTFQLGKFREETLRDDNNNPFPGLVADLLAWVGLQCVSANAVGRLKDLTEDNAATLSDAKIATLIASFPVGAKPDLLFMSRRSHRQLQLSRSVTLLGNGNVTPIMDTIAPAPTESNGIPIVVTDSIKDTEKLS